MYLNIKLELLEKNIIVEDTQYVNLCHIVNIGVTKNINLNSFKVKVEINDVIRNTTSIFEYPDSNINLLTTDQDNICSFNYQFIPDITHNIKVEYFYNNEKIEKSFDFVGPRPKKPYNSWIWSNGAWRSPVEYPAFDKHPLETESYEWDEDSLSWVPLGGYTVE
jgi:hypothetical protein